MYEGSSLIKKAWWKLDDLKTEELWWKNDDYDRCDRVRMSCGWERREVSWEGGELQREPIPNKEIHWKCRRSNILRSDRGRRYDTFSFKTSRKTSRWSLSTLHTQATMAGTRTMYDSATHIVWHRLRRQQSPGHERHTCPQRLSAVPFNTSSPAILQARVSRLIIPTDRSTFRPPRSSPPWRWRYQL